MISFNYVFSKLLSNEECYACDFVITTGTKENMYFVIIVVLFYVR